MNPSVDIASTLLVLFAGLLLYPLVFGSSDAHNYDARGGVGRNGAAVKGAGRVPWKHIAEFVANAIISQLLLLKLRTILRASASLSTLLAVHSELQWQFMMFSL